MPEPTEVKKSLAEIHIIANEDGTLTISAPPDPLLVYGLLHLAMDDMQERLKRATNEHKQRIAVVSAMPKRNGG